MNFRRRIYEIIEPSAGHHHSKVFDIFIMSLIVLSVTEVILESFEPIRESYGHILDEFEKWSVIIFTIEYLLRLFTADLLYPKKHAFMAVVSTMTSFYGIIDLAAILPFYLPLILTLDLRFVRILRLLRLFRILKLTRYNHSMELVIHVLRDKRAELGITVFVTFILMLLASAFMYFAEHEAQPDAFPNIVAAFWWAVTTLTTVGYGDVYPITDVGKIIASFMAILGIAVVALPTGILSSAFFDMTRSGKAQKGGQSQCPHCGEPLD